MTYKENLLYEIMIIDPYKHKERYIKWKGGCKEGIPSLSEANSDLVLKYLNDMENGLNISSINKKGARSYSRLNSLKQRIVFLSKVFQDSYNLKDITKISEQDLFSFFTKMRNGEFKTLKGKNYQSVSDYVKIFKAFWHWHQKVNRKEGKEVIDITSDLDTSNEKPRWVYLDENQVRKLADNAIYDYKVLIWFLMDTGIRSPSELINIKVSDLHNGFKELNIREEVSKTFGRRIKLMLCSELLKEYIKEKVLEQDDYLFSKTPSRMNQYLKRLGWKVLGDKESPAGQKYSEITLYDFRHISCCYWLPRYKSESALKYRFGWKKSDKIHYYSELLGMKDTISEEDLLIDVTKTELEQRIATAERRSGVFEEEVLMLREQMNRILESIKMFEIGV